MKKKNKEKLKNSRRKTREITYEGTICGAGKNYAFFIPASGKGDLYIDGDDLHGAIHGDRVLVRKTSRKRGAGECVVVKILERTKAVFVALTVGDYAIPTEKGMPRSIAIVRDGSIAVEDGHLVVCRMLDDQPIFCTIIEDLGKEGETDAEVMRVVREFSLPLGFPAKVNAECETIPLKIPPEELSRRRDFTADSVITIDGDDSKDFDDAICVVRRDKGYTLQVHIADVSHYVLASGAIDKEALKRGTSVYFADRVIPMLPEVLSNDVCSLVEGQNRLTLSIIMDFDMQGDLKRSEIVKGVIRSKARTTYSVIADLLDESKPKSARYLFLTDMLSSARELALILKERRIKRGSVEFDLAETQFEFDKNKRVVGVNKAKRLISHEIIEEFMLAANETVAKTFFDKKIPFVYRVHSSPPAEKISALCDFLATIGLSFPSQPSPEDYSRLLEETDERLKGVVSKVALRSMSKAEYSAECKGHFGLAAKFYCHFTSPIRRYPDLAVHRIISDYLSGKKTENYAKWVNSVAVSSSGAERKAEEAERRADEILKAQFMLDKIGFEYDAIVSGVTERGIFAETDFGVEGMIKAESFPERFKYYEKAMRLVFPSFSIGIGESVRVKVERVVADKVEFSFVCNNN
jgi:ribonuclease R